MAINTVWSVDLGKSSLKAVKLRRDRNNVEIVDIDKVDYPASQNGVDPAAQSKEALTAFQARKDVKDPVVVAHPGQGTFQRFIKVPAFDEKKVGEMVGYEASQQIPFPLDEVVWDFHVIDRDYLPGEEREVALFAVRREAMDDFLLDFSQHDMSVQTVSIGYLGLFNFVAHDIAPEEPSVVLDIGATHTDLVLVDGRRFWIRPLPHSGNEITKAIMERFKLGFAEAEKLKLDTAKVPQKAVKIFQAVIQPKLKDLVSEIHRSIGFYRSQAGEVTFKKLYLLGNGSKIIGIKKFLEESLGMQVVKVQTINHFRVSRGVNLKLLQSNLPSFATSLGCGLQALDLGSCRVDLVPHEEKVQREFRRKQKHAFIAAAIVLVAILIAHLMIKGKIDAVTKVVSDTRKVTAPLEKNDDKLLQGDLKEKQRLVQRLKEVAEVRRLALNLQQGLEAAFGRLPAAEAHVIVTPKGDSAEAKKVERKVLEEDLLKRVWIPWLQLTATTYPEEQKRAAGGRGKRRGAANIPTVPAIKLEAFVMVQARNNDVDSVDVLKKNFKEPLETELTARKVLLLKGAGVPGSQELIHVHPGSVFPEIYYDGGASGPKTEEGRQQGGDFYGAKVTVLVAMREPEPPGSKDDSSGGKK